MSKVIVITGAGSGLGAALARRFAADGEKVVLLARTLSKIEAVAATLGGNAMAIGCDVASPDSVRAAFAQIAARHGKLDVLINNAAVYEPFTIAEATDRQITDILNTNLLGPILCCRSAIPLLSANGHIINVSSESVDVPFPHLTLYQTSKAGLEEFSERLYHELWSTSLRVTVIRAGSMMGDVPGEGAASSWDPAAARNFAMAAMAAGLDLRARPITQFHSVTQMFRNVIDLPPDLHARLVLLHARKPA